jgi:hypothetical protein
MGGSDHARRRQVEAVLLPDAAVTASGVAALENRERTAPHS